MNKKRKGKDNFVKRRAFTIAAITEDDDVYTQITNNQIIDNKRHVREPGMKEKFRQPRINLNMPYAATFYANKAKNKLKISNFGEGA